jgi:feruloyl-CoA synthase
MLCSNQQAKTQMWPFLATEPPVLVDWLPWSHTFGGSHNFNLVVRHGGTMYIDAGRPVPVLFDTTLTNLHEIAPTIYFNVPRGYDMLVPALRRDAALRQRFFSRLRVVFYAAAALPAHLWHALHELVAETATDGVPLICSGWGTTETAPIATECHFQATQPGVIGVPAPGIDVKLVPKGGRLEIRVRGANVTPGYWRRPDLTAAQFDNEGFCLTGDSVRFVDPARPECGLLFDGRLSEDFKLDSGTWVNVTMLRTKAIASLAPVAQDIVVAGHDRSEIGLLIFPSIPACRDLARSLPADAPLQQVLEHPAVCACVRHGLAALRDQGAGSSTFATRAILLADSPAIDRGEITDKGHVNQGAVLRHRAQMVEHLYATNASDHVIRLPT